MQVATSRLMVTYFSNTCCSLHTNTALKKSCRIVGIRLSFSDRNAVPFFRARLPLRTVRLCHVAAMVPQHYRTLRPEICWECRWDNQPLQASSWCSPCIVVLVVPGFLPSLPAHWARPFLLVGTKMRHVWCEEVLAWGSRTPAARLHSPYAHK